MIGGALAVLGYAALGWAAILLELAPVGAAASGPPAPDLLFCVTAAFAARRGGGAPTLAVFLVGLLRDALSGGALGLGALALTIASLGVRAGAARAPSFVAKWGLAVAWAAAAAAISWIGLLLSLSPTPPLSDVALRVAMTALAYPPVALAVMATGLGRGRGAPDADGPRLRRLA